VTSRLNPISDILGRVAPTKNDLVKDAGKLGQRPSVHAAQEKADAADDNANTRIKLDGSTPMTNFLRIARDLSGSNKYMLRSEPSDGHNLGLYHTSDNSFLLWNDTTAKGMLVTDDGNIWASGNVTPAGSMSPGGAVVPGVSTDPNHAATREHVTERAVFFANEAANEAIEVIEDWTNDNFATKNHTHSSLPFVRYSREERMRMLDVRTANRELIEAGTTEEVRILAAATELALKLHMDYPHMDAYQREGKLLKGGAWAARYCKKYFVGLFRGHEPAAVLDPDDPSHRDEHALP
jgi:hypothetical protein